MKKTYLEFHGTSIYNEKQLQILDAASFDDFQVLRHERLTTGKYIITKYNTAQCFLHNDNLYYFMTEFHGQISGFFKLNTSPTQCEKGKYGVYFEVYTYCH